MANIAASIQITHIILIARGKFDKVCALIGWQMAMYLSTVKAVIVKTDEYDIISMKNVLNIQNPSPNRHGYASHILYNSGGRPKNKKIK